MSPREIWIPPQRRMMIGLLKASSRKYSQTVLMVTHNEVIAQSCDRIFRIEDGRLCPEGGCSCENHMRLRPAEYELL